MSNLLPPINLKKWIDENRDKLKPPVANRELYEMDDFIIMIVGGPNNRKDFHDDAGAEFFHQIEGDMVLRVMEEGKPRDIKIREGETFLLPPHMHHSPQRFANTIGIVVERKRTADELDGFLWYCENCNTKLYEEYIPLENIVSDLPKVFERFWNNDENRTCKKCGTVMEKPS